MTTSASRCRGSTARSRSGEARFAAEFPLDGMVYAALVYSTIARGRIATLDTAAAEAAPGVVLVMTHENAPRMKPTPMFMTDAEGGRRRRSADHAGRPRSTGTAQPVAVVLAETQEQADHAASLVRVDLRAAAGRTSFDEAKADGAPRPTACSASRPSSRSATPRRRWPRRRSASMHVYRTPRHNHNAIELHAVTVAWEGDG